jgi:hypothetical protein
MRRGGAAAEEADQQAANKVAASQCEEQYRRQDDGAGDHLTCPATASAHSAPDDDGEDKHLRLPYNHTSLLR